MMTKKRTTKSSESRSNLFPALLKYWRGQRGLSQLDLSLAADVSARHISFLETGRAKPSKEMVLSLASVLQVPFRQQNSLLNAAGFDNQFEEPDLHDALSGPIGKAVELMLKKQEPYPMLVMDWGYDVVRLNTSAQRLLAQFISDPSALGGRINLFEMIFDPKLFRPFIIDWETTAHTLLSNLHRTALLNSHDNILNNLVTKIFSYPDVPDSWRQPDFSKSSDPTLTLKLKKGDLELLFLTTVTNFNAPENITLEELRIECFFPLNAETERVCETLV